MPVVTQPDVIEQSDFSGGWSPDGVNETTDPTTLIDVLNLLLDRNTGSLQTRRGYRRLREELSGGTGGTSITADHYVKQLYHFGVSGSNYLIAVVVKLAVEADNVQFFRINLNGNAVKRIDDTGVTWSHPEAMFWFQSIDGLLFGGSRSNPMFRWNPDTDTWTDDVATPNTKEWVDDTGAGVTTASEYGRDYAWTGKEFVEYNGDVYTPNKDIRFAEWESGERYRKGDYISRKQDGYFRSYKCIDDHTGSGTNSPDDGADWEDFWKREKLPSPQNEDNETRPTWSLVPPASETSISMWFADRLWLRFDGQGDNSRAQYSAPVKPDKGEDIPNVSWNPKDWAPGNDFRGQGGGWVPFNDGKHGGVITAMHGFGQYGIVFKRRSVWVISGSDDATWQVRRAGRGMGAVGSQAVTELNGLVYFLSDDGLYATDGTACEEVPGNEKVQQYIKQRLDGQMQRELIDGAECTVFRHDGFIGIAMPDSTDDAPYVTLFYDPESESFFKTDLPVLDWQGYRDDGVAKAAFCRAPDDETDSPLDLVYIYGKANDGDQDDTGADDYAATDIAWYLKTAWWAFGTTRQMRRIRRIWAACNFGDTMDAVITQYRDWNTSAVATATTTNANGQRYIEGLVMPDAHSLQLKLSAPEAPATVFSIAVDTQPRRDRYHA